MFSNSLLFAVATLTRRCGLLSLITVAATACGESGGLSRDEYEQMQPGAPATGGNGVPAAGSPATQVPPPEVGGVLPEGARAAPGGFYIQGNTIFDVNNRPRILRGVNRPSLEWGVTGTALSAQDFVNMAAWGANVVRIPLNQVFWLEDRVGYQSWVKSNTDQAITAGLAVILDLHWNDLGTGEADSQHVMADAGSIAFWESVATAYKDDGRVIFELYNEPHDMPWSVWQNGGSVVDVHHSGVTFEAVGMQQMYDAVRGVGADNVVIATGLDWGYSLRGVPELNGYNIAYASHLYSFPHKLRPNWDADWFYLAQKHPVILTEFGTFHGNEDCNAEYDQEVVDFAQANNISWTAWAWFVGGCTFPSLLTSWNGTPSPSGEVVRAALEQHAATAN